MPMGAAIELEVLKAYLEGTAPTKPSKLWVGLAEEEQTRDLESKTIKAELAYTGYERKELVIASGLFTFTEGSSGAVSKAVIKSALELFKNTGADEHDAAKYFLIVGAAKASESGKLYFYGKWEKEGKIQPTVTKVEIPASGLEIT